MLDLDSPRWSTLEHAYGSASNIPNLLRQLENYTIAHQNDVYSASFAAVPHVIYYILKGPSKADSSYFHFPAWVEICRQNKSITVQEDLEKDYYSALAQLPELIAQASTREWDITLLLSAISALAAIKGFPIVAEAVLKLNSKVASDFMKWFYEQ